MRFTLLKESDKTEIMSVKPDERLRLFMTNNEKYACVSRNEMLVYHIRFLLTDEMDD